METNAVRKISAQSLNRWVAEEKPFILIDTLTGDHFKAIHLPGATHACVFEVSFLDQIAAITGCNRETAKSRLRYAVNKLRAAIDEPARTS